MPHPFFCHSQVTPWFKVSNNQLQLTLFVHKELELTQLFIRYEPDNEEELRPMKPCGQQGELVIWRGELPLNRDSGSVLYTFKALTAQEQWWVHAAGVSGSMPPRQSHFHYNPQQKPPVWVQDQVFYQIFPDRFCNGDPSISVQNGEYQYGGGTHPVIAKQWGEPVAADHLRTGASEFYGGDLAGIQSKQHYLQ